MKNIKKIFIFTWCITSLLSCSLNAATQSQEVKPPKSTLAKVKDTLSSGIKKLLSHKKKFAVVAIGLQADFMEVSIKNTESTGDAAKIKGIRAVPDTSIKDYLPAVNAFTAGLREKGCPVIFPKISHPLEHDSFYSHWENKNGELVEPPKNAVGIMTKDVDGIQVKGKSPKGKNHIPALEGLKTVTPQPDQMLWPDHCVKGTPGAKIVAMIAPKDEVLETGTNPHHFSYSAFKDKFGSETEFKSILEKKDITDVIIYGVSADGYLEATAKDALENGFQVHIVTNLCRSDDKEKTLTALHDLYNEGATLYFVGDLNDGTKFDRQDITFIATPNEETFYKELQLKPIHKAEDKPATKPATKK
jgi:nicotinamidase/pyrazinamidase